MTRITDGTAREGIPYLVEDPVNGDHTLASDRLPPNQLDASGEVPGTEGELSQISVQKVTFDTVTGAPMTFAESRFSISTPKDRWKLTSRASFFTATADTEYKRWHFEEKTGAESIVSGKTGEILFDPELWDQADPLTSDYGRGGGPIRTWAQTTVGAPPTWSRRSRRRRPWWVKRSSRGASMGKC